MHMHVLQIQKPRLYRKAPCVACILILVLYLPLLLPFSMHCRFLTTPEREAKQKSLRKRAVASERVVTRLKSRIQEMVKDQSVRVGDDLNDDLTDILRDHTSKIQETCPEESMRRILWEQQIEALSKRNRRQIRWHPLLVRWCLNLRYISSAAYHAVRSSGFLSLPSERTLRDYSNFIQAQTGFCDEVTRMLVEEMKLSTLSAPKKHVSILMDEIKVQQNLVYNKHTGKIVGFVDLGQINNDLIEVELKKESESARPPVADSVLAIMIRGIFVHLNFPYAYFPSKKLNGEQIYPIIWETVKR